MQRYCKNGKLPNSIIRFFSYYINFHSFSNIKKPQPVKDRGFIVNLKIAIASYLKKSFTSSLGTICSSKM